jgi:SAM-dependent methyltransferase
MPAPEPSRLRRAWALLRPRQFALARQRCPLCDAGLVVRLRNDETGVRCLRCGASAVHRSLAAALHRHVGSLAQRDCCELSARGALTAFLRRHARSVALSEFFPDLPPGAMRDGVRCEDVCRLGYADASFDLVTHTEVLEHVADDALAFAELRRVLRPGGWMLFTVPLHPGATLERARLREGTIEHLEPPAYHGDPIRGGAPVLAFRDYGEDIVARLAAAGFSASWVEPPDPSAAPWGFARAVVCARR